MWDIDSIVCIAMSGLIIATVISQHLEDLRGDQVGPKPIRFRYLFRCTPAKLRRKLGNLSDWTIDVGPRYWWRPWGRVEAVKRERPREYFWEPRFAAMLNKKSPYTEEEYKNALLGEWPVPGAMYPPSLHRLDSAAQLATYTSRVQAEYEAHIQRGRERAAKYETLPTLAERMGVRFWHSSHDVDLNGTNRCRKCGVSLDIICATKGVCPAGQTKAST